MKKALILFATLILMMPTEMALAESEVSLYVSPNGNDYNNGSNSAPYKTIYRAREGTRYLRQNGYMGKIHIIIKEGEYFLEDPIYLDSRDHDIVFEAEGDVSFTGAMIFDSAESSEASEYDPLYRRFPDGSRQNIRVTDMSEIENFDDIPEVNGMFADISDYIITVDGYPMINARYPNDKMLKVNEVYRSGNVGNSSFVIGYTDNNISNWQTPEEIYFEGYGSTLWAYEKIRLSSIDSAKKQITSANTYLYQGVYNGAQVWFSNIPEELDKEGEYYIDRVNKKLYYYPLFQSGKIKISVSKRPLLDIVNTKNITFTGITFENTRTKAVKINGCNNIVLDNCEISDTGAEAVNIRKSVRSGVRNSLVIRTGGGGIKFSECGNKYDLTKSNNFVINNEICDFSRVVPTYSPAVWVDGIDDTISHNIIHESIHSAIIFYGNDNIISNNEIYNVLVGTEDAGAIYTYGDGSSRGNVIENNFIHHLGDGKKGFAGTGIFAVYFDNFNGGQIVRNNLFYDMPSGIHINGGGNNTVKDNIFSLVEVPVYGHSYSAIHSTDMWNGYLKLYKDKSIWEAHYPELADIPNPSEPLLTYRQNVISENLFSLCKNIGENVLSTTGARVENNVQTLEDVFEDKDNFDFSLKGKYDNFVSFDMKSVGIY